MARCLVRVLLLYLLLLAAWAENDDEFAQKEDEKLSSRSLKQTDRTAPVDSDEIIREQMRSIIIPIRANITMGTDDNVQSLGLVLGPEGVSVSHSNSFTYPNGGNGSKISGSRSSSFAAGLDGLSGARADVVSSPDENGKNKTNAEVNTFSRGDASSNTFAGVKDGVAATGATTSIGTVKSESSAGLGSDTSPSDSHNKQDKILEDPKNNGESSVLVHENLDRVTRPADRTESVENNGKSSVLVHENLDTVTRQADRTESVDGSVLKPQEGEVSERKLSGSMLNGTLPGYEIVESGTGEIPVDESSGSNSTLIRYRYISYATKHFYIHYY